MKEAKEDIGKQEYAGELVFDIPMDGMSARDTDCTTCECFISFVFTGSGAAYITTTSREKGCGYTPLPCTIQQQCANPGPARVEARYDPRYVSEITGPDIYAQGQDSIVGATRDCTEKCEDSDITLQVYKAYEWISVSESVYGSVSISGDTQGHGGEGSYETDSEVTLTATSTDDCYEFDHWEYIGASHGYEDPHGINGSTNPSVTITALPFVQPDEYSAYTAESSHYIAVFKIKRYRLIVKPNIAEASDLDIDESYDCGSTPTIRAYAKDGCDYRFVMWSDGVTDARRTVTMDGNKTFTAIFERITYSLTVTNLTGHGSYSVSKPGPYHKGDVVYVYATPEPCYYAEYPSQKIEFYCQNQSVTVSFYKNIYTLTISSSGSGYVSVNGAPGTSSTSIAFDCGTTVTLRAVPASCWKFSHWSGAASGSSKTISITMDGHKSVNAVFVACKEDNRIIHYKGDVIFDTYSGNPMYQSCDCS